MNRCPYCTSQEDQIKAGKTEAGSQRYKCKRCQRRYTPEPHQMYGDEMRRAAVKWYADGAGYRQIARHFGVDHVTVMNWVKAHPCQVKRRCTSSKWTSYSPLWARKKQAYLVTLVERRTSCIVGWCVTSERDQVTLQSLLDASPPAVWYYSDLFATYKTLLYTPGVHTAMPDKS